MPDFVKISKGRILVDQFSGTGAPSGRWSEANGTTTISGWTRESGQVRGSAGASEKRLVNYSALIPRMFIQATLRFTGGTPQGGLFGCYDFSSQVRGYYLNLLPATNQIQIAVRGESSTSLTQLAIASKTLAADTDYPVQFYADIATRNIWVDGTTATHSFTHTGWSGRKRQHTVAGIQVQAGTGDLIVKDFIWMPRNTVLVYGLSGGQIAKILDDEEAVVAQAAESGGVATITLSRFSGFGSLIPITGWPRLLVTESNGTTEVGGFDAEFIYPGDRFMPDPTPAVPVWYPSSALNPSSGDLDDTGGFTPSESVSYSSQKNMNRAGFDPRTGVLLAVQGTFGAFSEDPVTSTKVLRSTDGGATWTQVADLADVIEFYEVYEPGSTTPEEYSIPLDIVPGANEGEWLLFDFAGGYYFSDDDGETWGAKQASGIGFSFINPEDSFPSFYGLFGGEGLFDTRNQAVHHYLEEQQMGYAYYDVTQLVGGTVGVRRSLGPNGSLGWETSLDPTVADYLVTDWALPVLAGANGRWILICDDFQRNGNPNVMINDSPDLDPLAWGTPFFLISEAFCTDIYGATGSGLNANFRRLNFGGNVVNPSGTAAKSSAGAGNARARLKFIPQDGHSAGGRWWLLGVRDTLPFSDDNGDTWSQALCDHTGVEGAMHPFLNWRRTYPDSAANAVNGGFRYGYPMVIDIESDPRNTGRLLAVGITYMTANPDLDRLGVSNRLAVFSASDDGGDTWSTVGQLPLSLLKTINFPPDVLGEGFSDHTATAAHIIQRITP